MPTISPRSGWSIIRLAIARQASPIILANAAAPGPGPVGTAVTGHFDSAAASLALVARLVMEFYRRARSRIGVQRRG